jgi:hypothetical protein
MSPPTGTHIQKRPILHSCPSFFKKKCVMIVQESFTLVLQACIHHALIKLIPHYLLFLYHYSLSPCSPNVQQLTAYFMVHYIIEFHILNKLSKQEPIFSICSLVLLSRTFLQILHIY